MVLHDPFFIGSRLLPAVKVGDATVSLEYAGETADVRFRYRWYIDFPDGREFSAADLKSGCGGAGVGVQPMMGTLLAFLSACGEGVNYGRRTGRTSENADLFPPEVAEWAAGNLGEIDALRFDLEESGNTYAEEDQ